MSEKLIHWSLSSELASRELGPAAELGTVTTIQRLCRARQVTHLNSIPRDPELNDDKNKTMSLDEHHFANSPLIASPDSPGIR